jgi:hypothetical protein
MLEEGLGHRGLRVWQLVVQTVGHALEKTGFLVLESGDHTKSLQGRSCFWFTAAELRRRPEPAIVTTIGNAGCAAKPSRITGSERNRRLRAKYDRAVARRAR